MKPIRSSRPKPPGCWAPFAALFLVAALPAPAPAGGISDPYDTEGLLSDRTRGLSDPLAGTCSSPAGTLTLARAVDVALCRNPATRTAWAQAREQAAAVGAAEGAWSPTATVTGGGDREFGRHVDAEGVVDSHPQNTGNAVVNLSWTLYDFGARTGRISSARGLLDAAAATANSTMQQTVFNVVQGFYGVVAAESNVAAAHVAERAYAKSLEVARGRREGGAATVADVLQAETAYDEAVLLRVQAEATVKTARGSLAILLGSRADEQYALQGDAIPPDLPALRGQISALIDRAAAQRPDLAAARAQVESAKADIQVARAAGLPTITLGATRNYDYATGIPSQAYNTIGFNLSIPVFSGYSVAYGVRQAQAALQVSEINAEQVRLNVSRDVWNGYYSLDSANQQLTATAALVKSAEDNESVALGRYRAGVGTIIDLLTAQAAAVTARQQRIGAELGWQVARAQLVLALGTLNNAAPLAGKSVLP